MKAVYVFILSGLTFICSHAADLEHELSADIKAYCQYIEAKNNAKKSTLLLPDVVVRAQNSYNDYPYQNNLTAALSKDLSDLFKYKQLKALVDEECAYYTLNQQALMQVEYAILSMQHQSLAFKLKKIQAAKHQLTHLLTEMKNKINTQNDTLINLYKIDSSLRRFDEAERDIQMHLAIKHPLMTNTVHLHQLLHELRIAQQKRKVTLDKLAQLNNWSFQIQAGAQNDSVTFKYNQETQPYLALFLRYNLGSLQSDHASKKSRAYYSNWKSKQVNGTQEQLHRLIQSIVQLKDAEEHRLKFLRDHYNKYYGLSKKLGTINSARASKLKQQIEGDRIMMNIEMNYLKYFIHLLKERI